MLQHTNRPKCDVPGAGKKGVGLLHENMMAYGLTINACTKEWQNSGGNRLWTALLVAVTCAGAWANIIDPMASAAKFCGVTRISVCEQNTHGSSHLASKLAQVKMHFEVMRLQESLTCGRLPQEGCTRLHKSCRFFFCVLHRTKTRTVKHAGHALKSFHLAAWDKQAKLFRAEYRVSNEHGLHFDRDSNVLHQKWCPKPTSLPSGRRSAK